MNEPATLPAPTEPAMQLIARAIERGTSAAEMADLYALAKQWRDDRAAEAFANAVTAFQAECPPVRKARQSVGKMSFAFASYDDIKRIVSPIQARHKIIDTYTTEALADGKVKVVCRIRVGIHTETTEITIPVPQGVVNDTQLYGQAVTYGKRYALCAALGIVVTDEDNDGQPADEGRCDPADLDALNSLMAEYEKALNVKVNESRTLGWLGAKSWAELSAAQLRKARDFYQRKIAEARKAVSA